jgi:hypothetical protein
LIQLVGHKCCGGVAAGVFPTVCKALGEGRGRGGLYRVLADSEEKAAKWGGGGGGGGVVAVVVCSRVCCRLTTGRSLSVCRWCRCVV